MDIFSLIALCLITAIAVAIIKQFKPELAIPTAVAAGCAVLLAALLSFSPIFSQLKSISESSGISSEYFKIMLKALGLCYLTQFASEVCMDFSQSSLASKIELCGKLALAAISLPLIVSLIKTVTKIVG